ncbi:MAG: ribulose 1,5-bisphosphate carboxylase large subunit [Candidatus Methanoplasma sp.]|jgi:ribulose-bisphosphate carboxylase large chain|nr:ribulose 1,5-bisphosphate carboxylase large subunit [Candidatus Methanoplasma sp.]
MKSYSYMHKGEPYDEDAFVVCKYRVATDLPIEKAAEAIAAEQSTGTWTGISTLEDDVFLKYGARIVGIDGDVVTIAYPEEDFSIEVGGIPQILSVVAGNLFGLDALKGVRLEDVSFPSGIAKKYKGPKFGVDGIRKALGRPEKPLVGTIVKPKIGLSPKKTAEYVYEAGSGGLTNSKDDETLVDQAFCPIEDRTKAVAESLDKLKEEGRLMLHAVNISTNGDKIVELAEDVQSWGAKQVMIDVITCGFAAVQAVAEDPKIKVPIHVHRTMHGAFTKDPLHGVSMLPITRLVRMCGGDALHIGTLGVGKMAGGAADKSNLGACLDAEHGHKSVMPVASGGVYPGIVSDIIKAAGLDVQIQAGGGVAGHPGGVRKGATAMSQAVDAAYDGIPAAKYAESRPELKAALDKWGSK